MSGDGPLISVVIPTKDRRRSLEHVLPTYLEQPEVLEVVVVIDGSTDGTREMLSDLVNREPRVKVRDNGSVRGVPYSRNAGIDVAAGEYIFVSEDDVELTEGFFATLLAHGAESGADVIAGRNIWRHEGETGESAIERTNSARGPAIDMKKIANDTSARLDDDAERLLIASPMLARAELFKAVRYDERYRVNFWREETDFQLSVQERGGVLVSCPHAICFNYILRNDRGGVHAAAGLRRLLWITVNNHRFYAKHREFIGAHFAVGSEIAFLARSAGSVLWSEMLLPRLIRVKRAVLGSK